MQEVERVFFFLKGRFVKRENCRRQRLHVKWTCPAACGELLPTPTGRPTDRPRAEDSNGNAVVTVGRGKPNNDVPRAPRQRMVRVEGTHYPTTITIGTTTTDNKNNLFPPAQAPVDS